jgi:hypothetical protein
MFYNALTPMRNFIQAWPHLASSLPNQGPGTPSGGITADHLGFNPIPFEGGMPMNPKGSQFTPSQPGMPFGAPGYGGYGMGKGWRGFPQTPQYQPFRGPVGGMPSNIPFAVQHKTGLSGESSGPRPFAVQNSGRQGYNQHSRPGNMGGRQPY